MNGNKKEYEVWKKYRYNAWPTLIGFVKIRELPSLLKIGDKIEVKNKGEFEIKEIDNIKLRIDVK